MEKEEKVLSLEDIKKKVKDAKDKKVLLKEYLTNSKYQEHRSHLLALLLPLVKEKRGKEVYSLVYDSLGESLEPVYFWVLDFMRERSPGGLGLDVAKGSEGFEASVTSGYFGEMGMRNTQMQAKAMEYLGAINQVIKSILNLLYDLREFEVRIKHYDDFQSEDKATKKHGVYALKGIWMDQVDIRKGRGSINSLAQDLNFITLRDAFFFVNSFEEVDRLDVNERVKNILRRKIEEYNSWLEFSEEEIRARYQLEKSYLKSQRHSLKLYVKWLKPYLKAAHKLGMKEFRHADIVHAFSTMEMELSLLGREELKPGNVHASYEALKAERKYYAVIEVMMKFRSLPSSVQGQGGRHYLHGGKVELQFYHYGLDDLEWEALEQQEFTEEVQLLEEYVGESLEALHNEMTRILGEKEEKKGEVKEEKRVHGLENPFKGIGKDFKNTFLPKDFHLSEKKKMPLVPEEAMFKGASEAAKKKSFLVYDVYKKQHGMMSWT